MNILGISAFYHDSAAALVRDGVVVAAAQEERFNRQKNTGVFPIQAINFCVQQSGLSFLDIDAVAYFEKPYLKFARVINDHLASFPFSLPAFHRSMPKWLDERLSIPLLIQEELNFEGPVYFVPHHLSHAACAFFSSGFSEAAVLTVDGVGERATMTTGFARGHQITVEKEMLYPDSVGLLYTAATVFLGFHAHGGEGKTMGLAGYGQPRFLPELRRIVEVKDDGSFRINPTYFRYRRGGQMWSRRLTSILGPARKAGEPLTSRHHDIAASFQALLEEILVKAATHLQRETKAENLCLAGGVALNCVANKKILDESGFRRIFIPPAAGDAGGAVGSALYVHHVLNQNPPSAPPPNAYLGPEYSDREILKALKASRLPYRALTEEELCREVAAKLQAGGVVAWFQGRMEYGPRSLGNRAILANPCRSTTRDHLNTQVKKRELFRPFAPVVLAENASTYFELEQESPFMLLAPKVRATMRDKLPAITHVDETARVQTVDRESNPLLRKLLAEFGALSGVPVLVNTSLNRNGEPVVCTPAQAIECFREMKVDLLALGNYLLEKS